MGKEYLDKLDPIILKQGLWLAEWGAKEMAWDRASAMEVAKAAAKAGFVILGGDVWRRDPSARWRPSLENWHSERRTGEDWPRFLERSKVETLAYMGKYPDPDDGSIKYVLVCELAPTT